MKTGNVVIRRTINQGPSTSKFNEVTIEPVNSAKRTRSSFANDDQKPTPKNAETSNNNNYQTLKKLLKNPANVRVPKTIVTSSMPTKNFVGDQISIRKLVQKPSSVDIK